MMEYRRMRVMKRRRVLWRNISKKAVMRLCCFALCLICFFCFYFQRIRPLVIRCAVSYAESMFLRSADRAVVQILSEENIGYADIVRLSRNADGAVTSVETDIVKIDTLKCRISDALSQMIAGQEYYEVAIPLGALFSKTLIDGWGPKIRFKMQLTATARVNFSHEFKSEGINQVLHLVMVDMDVSGSLVVLGHNRGLDASTSVFAAQTLIVGNVPGAFTEVNQGMTQDTAGTINDYGAN